MPDIVSRSGTNSSANAAELASHEPENICRADTPPPPASAVNDALARTTTSYLPADHPASGVSIHKFPATGEVSWACMSDCTSSQGLTGLGLSGAEAAAIGIGSTLASAAALVTVATVTPISCYVACSDLEGLPPQKQPEPIEVPDASVYSPAFP